MNKKLLILMSLCLFINLFPNFVTADESDESRLYIKTLPCPKEYYDYVDGNIERFVLSANFSNDLEGIIRIGSPFSFLNDGSDIFYFPILCNDNVIYTFRVFKNSDGKCSGVLGEMFVEEFNKLIGTSINNPLSIYMEGSDIVAYINDEKNVIYSYPKGTEDDSYKIYSETSKSYEIVDIKRECNNVNFSLNIKDIASKTTNELNKNASNGTPAFLYLGVKSDIIETQGSQEWCAAFATAFIIRHIKGSNDNTLAKDVMNKFYDNPSYLDTITESQVIEYANYRSVYPTRKTSTLSNSLLINEIYNGRMVYLRMYRLENSEKKYHAVVLRGYNSSLKTWSIWNPWYKWFETFEMDGSYTPSNYTSREYYYFQTTYNWK